ncbi:MAG TPA: two-component sensor histidine kinase [Cytophagales bacterium]|jgi:signal transduction histidine kinase|nr:two-component sensor histidine kinase [Cytophagales bacterium]
MAEVQPVVTDSISVLTSKLKAAFDLRISDLKQSIKITTELLNQFNDLGHLSLANKAKNNLGLFFLIQGEFEKAHNYSIEALTYFESAHDDHGIADAKYNIGSIYYRTNKYHQALLLLADCLKIYREQNDFYNQARTLKSMGTIYEYFSDQDKAVEVYEKSIEASKAIHERGLESNALNPLSAIYYKQGKVELAMETIERSIRLKNETKDIRGLAFALYGRGKIFIKLGLYSKAIKDFEETILISEKVGDKLGLCMTYNKLGVAYMESGDLNGAKKQFNKALELSERYHIEFILFKVYYHLYLLAKKENQPERALDFLEKHLTHKELVINKENYTLIKSYEAVSRIESLERDAKIQLEKNQIIENKNAELDSFFYRISHDLKGPISSLMGLHNVVMIEVKDPVALKYFELCVNQVNRMNNIVMNLIELTQLNHSEKQVSKINFPRLVDECINSYSYFENFKNITFIKEIEEFEFQSEWVIVNTILQNLIENAIKYAAHFEPFIKISIRKKNESIEIRVIDNGQGIDESHQAKIFNMFFRATERIKGSGLGLYILKRAVERLNGTIHLASRLNEGSTFTVTLPA